MERCDILIAGAGLAGLVAATALARDNLSVTVIDPGPKPGPKLGPEPGTEAERGTHDPRSTAFLRPAQALLNDVGVWAALAPSATPLAQLRIIDTVSAPDGGPLHPVETRTFLPEADGPFGWNLPNGATRATLARRLAATPNVTLRFGAKLTGILARDNHARVSLDDGTRLQARLVIGADGAASAVRQASGIGVQTTRYGQKALAFAVTHSAPHLDVSTEVYASGGAFTLVPLLDRDGQPASAVVWMEDGPRALALAALKRQAFSRAATDRSTGILGDLRLAGDRATFPVISQRADTLSARRVALIAEAAHVLPPIGAQGLNTSLADVAALVALVAADPDALGSTAMLARYERARTTDIRARMAAVDLFNRVCRSGNGWVRRARIEGLRLVHDLDPVRRTIIRAGLGG